ncbi:hypothetical protein TEA_026297 [Camellia sinensis var. sinensis]|uniref:EamA domain-containing protein n=1 Tax=Camellia sinensis var. sinensis TaxID=542762 RepID=A0A4S4DCD9_CAMSN|nr:hypothetical protein TEA_026297 [Camellia sinensis var. sinensis]
MSMEVYKRAKPYLAMILLQFGYAGLGIIAKFGLNQGMSLYTFAVYRNAVAALVFAPFALLFERPVIDQNLFYTGMKYTTATFATAMCNIVPAITFLMAWILRETSTPGLAVGQPAVAFGDGGWLASPLSCMIVSWGISIVEGALNMGGLDLFWNFIRALLRKWEFEGWISVRSVEAGVGPIKELLVLGESGYCKGSSATAWEFRQRIRVAAQQNGDVRRGRRLVEGVSLGVGEGRSAGFVQQWRQGVFPAMLAMEFSGHGTSSDVEESAGGRCAGFWAGKVVQGSPWLAGSAWECSRRGCVAAYRSTNWIAMTKMKSHGPITNTSTSANQHDLIKGSLMITTGCFCWAAFVILQAITLKSYPAELSLTTLICMLGTLQGTILTLLVERGNMAIWSLSWDTKLICALYGGIIGSGVSYCISGVVMKEKGPVFVTAFNPLSMVIIAIIGSFVLAEQIHVGSVVGAIVIVIGLYLVIWGKSKDEHSSKSDNDQRVSFDQHDCNHNTETEISGPEFVKGITRVMPKDEVV